MKDIECTAFLKEYLPKLLFRWPGFRKVRGQVCKRLNRIEALDLSGLPALWLLLRRNRFQDMNRISKVDFACTIGIGLYHPRN
ncbi:MAG: hypothetical protein M0P57_08030 [Syntrophales bacterium]|nr:hypothetical protein [Syntrophales bacterium]